MNKRIPTLTLVVCLFAAAAFGAGNEGAWTATAYDKKQGYIHLNLNFGVTNNMGTTMPIAAFTGLTDAQINAPAMTPVNFEKRAEAGTIAFEGTFRNGRGAGQFTFRPNRAFFDTVRALGVDVTARSRRHHFGDRDEDDQLFAYAMHDVSTAFIKSMIAEGYRVSLDEYLELRIFNVTPEYIREMRSLGFKDLSHRDLIDSKIHRVTPQYVREMRAAGWDLSLRELQESAIHGATPKFAEEMRKLGYGNLSHHDLVSFRIHRVTAEYIRELRELGYDKVSADDLVAMRIHRVTPEFIRELEKAGYTKVPVRKLIQMRIHGIDAKMLEAMRD